MRRHISVGFIRHTGLFLVVPVALMCYAGVHVVGNSNQSYPNSSPKKISYVTRKLLSERDLLPHPSPNTKTTLPLSDAKQYMDRGGIAFIENKGQIIDTKGNLRPDLKYVANAGGVKLYFRNDGVSYAAAGEVTPMRRSSSQSGASTSSLSSYPLESDIQMRMIRLRTQHVAFV